MNTVKLIELSSGFGNVPNNIILAADYYEHDVSGRPGSGYDKVIECELPDGAKERLSDFGAYIEYNGKSYFDFFMNENDTAIISGFGKNKLSMKIIRYE